MTQIIQLHSGSWQHIKPSVRRLENIAIADSESVCLVEIPVHQENPVRSVTVSDRIRRLEADPSRAALLAEARNELSKSSLLDDAHPFKRLRLSKGFSQAKLANAARTTQATIAKLEKPRSDPHLSTLLRLAKALGVDGRDVFECFASAHEVSK